MIRPKEGGDRLLKFNEAQRLVDTLLDNQLHETGKVRALVLKARQLGISTYLGGRFYHKLTRNRGRRAFLMAHEKPATKNLYGMIRRFADHDPHVPRLGRSNDDEFTFADLDSGLAVGVAGAANAAGTGRSFTLQYAHLSEVALWQSASDHALGLLEAVPDVAGTEVVMESTAQGMGNYWHTLFMAAVRGESEYQAIFIPFFVHEEYRTDPPDDWTPPDAFAEMRDLHKLADDQLYWAWLKNRSIATQSGESPDEICWKFRQEYPCTIEEAFRASRRGGFIKASVVLRALDRFIPDLDDFPLVLGCDFATGGGGDANEQSGDEGEGETSDYNCFISRRGRVAGRELFTRFQDRDSVSVADRLAAEINRLKPAMVFMDTGGGGAGVFDILSSRGFRKLHLVDFGTRANDPRKYRNKRSEIWGLMRDWFSDPGGVDLLRDDALEAELTSVPVKDDTKGILLMSKKDIKKKYGFSPDGADALATTFAATLPAGPGHNIRAGGTLIVSPIGAY